MATLSLMQDAEWQAVLAHLPRNYAELADEHKQLETQYGNAKITTADWLLRFILLHAGANLPLRQTVAMIAEAGGPSLSAMRLHMKMRRASPYLQSLVERMVGWTGQAKPEAWAGYTMTLIDATILCGPGATYPDARIHTKLRVADVAVLDAIVTDTSGGETFKNFSFRTDELVVADRGYSNPASIAHAVEHGAAVLVRYNRGALPVSHRGKSLDVLKQVRKLRGTKAVMDLPVYFEHKGDRISGRLIATRLPVAEAKKARKRLRKEQGPRVTKASLEAAGYVILFTTVPRERMDASMCIKAYRLRWQIELQFKRWKSLCGFDRLPNYRDDTIVAWLYAKVLLGILLDRMSSIRGELSPPVQLAPVQRPARRPRRRRIVAPDGSATVEAHEHSLPADVGSAPATLSA